jgi:predicted component of type VI protein secretion system
MKEYEITVKVEVPDNFDEEGISINIEEALDEHPDFDFSGIINIVEVTE